MDGVFPYVFYGATKISFEELREAECKERVTMMGLTPEVYFYWNSFWDSYRSGKSFRYAITIGSVDLFQRILFHQFNPIRSLEIIDRIKSDLMLFNLDIRLVNHSSSFCTFISSNCLLFALISPRVSGIVSSDKDIILVYQLMFDNYFSNGTSFQKFLKDCEIVLKKKINSK